jgi:hypothetical protein
MSQLILRRLMTGMELRRSNLIRAAIAAVLFLAIDISSKRLPSAEITLFEVIATFVLFCDSKWRVTWFLIGINVGIVLLLLIHQFGGWPISRF